jgi:hypothetical protein
VLFGSILSDSKGKKGRASGVQKENPSLKIWMESSLS